MKNIVKLFFPTSAERRQKAVRKMIRHAIKKFADNHQGKYYLVLEHLHEPVYYRQQAQKIFSRLTGNRIDTDDLALGCLHLAGYFLNHPPKPALWYLYDYPYAENGFIGLIIGENAKLAFFPHDCCRFERMNDPTVVITCSDSHISYRLKMADDEKDHALYVMYDQHCRQKITDSEVIRDLILNHRLGEPIKAVLKDTKKSSF